MFRWGSACGTEKCAIWLRNDNFEWRMSCAWMIYASDICIYFDKNKVNIWSVWSFLCASCPTSPSQVQSVHMELYSYEIFIFYNISVATYCFQESTCHTSGTIDDVVDDLVNLVSMRQCVPHWRICHTTQKRWFWVKNVLCLNDLCKRCLHIFW